MRDLACLFCIIGRLAPGKASLCRPAASSQPRSLGKRRAVLGESLLNVSPASDPLPAPRKERLEVIISLNVGRERKTPQSIVGGAGRGAVSPQARGAAVPGRWRGRVAALSRPWDGGHLPPQLPASSHVRTDGKSRGFFGSRRPGPRLPTGSLDPGALCHGQRALGSGVCLGQGHGGIQDAVTGLLGSI